MQRLPLAFPPLSNEIKSLSPREVSVKSGCKVLRRCPFGFDNVESFLKCFTVEVFGFTEERWGIGRLGRETKSPICIFF
jgi:hypothetical protein